MSFRFPYVSIDIETTGVDLDRSHVLQIAAVYDNGKDIEELPKFDQKIHWKEIGYLNPWSFKNNILLLDECLDENSNKETCSISEAQVRFDKWLSDVQPEGKLTAAGKNIGTFDFPILKNNVNGFRLGRFLHRFLDPGCMFTHYFDHIPNLSEINKVTGRMPVSHDALDDALDVVYAIRYHWNR